MEVVFNYDSFNERKAGLFHDFGRSLGKTTEGICKNTVLLEIIKSTNFILRSIKYLRPFLNEKHV